MPISNYFGWFLTVFTVYLCFTLYLQRQPTPAEVPATWDRLAILFYIVCALGNLLLAIPAHGSAALPIAMTDPSGISWPTASILEACLLVSLFCMLPFPLIAWYRLAQLRR